MAKNLETNMPSYTKRPTVTRFKMQATKPGRVIRVATVSRRERPKTQRPKRKMLAMRPTRKR